jgi:tetratricopeptide (TPR) repeat protein
MKRTATVAENGIARSTVEECYNYIISDFKEAITLFKKYQKTKNQFLNITATNILLSRAYLYMENWEEAAKAATEAINTSDGLSNFTGLSSVILGSYDTKEVEWVTNITYYSLWSTYFYVATDLRTLYESGDQRKSFWINSNNTIKKLSTKGDYQNYQSLRIAEAYLNRAEAYAKSNNDQGALADLNELRRNRITDYQNENLSGEALKEAIRTERRKELCFEGLRWFDLRRYAVNTAHKQAISVTHEWHTKVSSYVVTASGYNTLKPYDEEVKGDWVLPVPEDVIDYCFPVLTNFERAKGIVKTKYEEQ